MKRRTDIKVKTYEADYGFMVDIVDNSADKYPSWDVWLYRKNIGVKMHMFGLLKEYNYTTKQILDIVERNLPEYYPDYDERYCQYDDVDQGYLDDYDYVDDGESFGCPMCGSTDVEMAAQV